MKYKVNDIFYSLQGEGINAGRPALFIRFAGCNLHCSFCDTDFQSYQLMSAQEILQAIKNLMPEAQCSTLIVLTGGEPTLQVDESLIDVLHTTGLQVAMESNGTHLPPPNLDWLTVSPKQHVVVERCNELKCIYDESGQVDDRGIQADHYLLQPCDTGDAEKNRVIIAHCVNYILSHPKWRLSLQTHKLINIK